MLRDHDPGETYSDYQSTYPRRTSPPGSPAVKKCCYDHEKYNKPTELSFFCCCYSCTGSRSTSILATLGVCCLVLGYTILGAFVFMALEGGLYHDTAVAASKSNPRGDSSVIGDLRTETVDRLWSITENLNILYRENWTRLATEEVLVFQEALFKVLKQSESGYISSSMGTMPYYQNIHKWSFSSSFLYSLTLITTIGFQEAKYWGLFQKISEMADKEECSDVQCNKLLLVGGSDYENFTRRSLHVLLKDELAMLCSWAGQKNNFKVADTTIMSILRKAVKMNFRTTTDKEFEHAVMDWLRFAKQRLSK